MAMECVQTIYLWLYVLLGEVPKMDQSLYIGNRLYSYLIKSPLLTCVYITFIPIVSNVKGSIPNQSKEFLPGVQEERACLPYILCLDFLILPPNKGKVILRLGGERG